MEGQCMVCLQEATDIEHLKLYIVGSEGCFVCGRCRMSLSKFAQEIRFASIRAKKIGYKKAMEKR